MTNIIRLLPDSVANQIAAGEVIQRPASVVKELVENALDAGATSIVVNIKDAGRTLIQVTDNGCGMSPTDARMSFERHATSKINHASDLFAIRTMGFRGEALASVAAIADVEMRTKQHEDETGTFLHVNATKVVTQEPVACGNGTSLQVKNLFFNVPARRKFLKSDAYELKLIVNEMQRIAIPNPDISFNLYHNGNPIFELSPANLRKRIVALFGKSVQQALIPIESETSISAITGFTGLPRYARKTMGEQFFFVNKRYMRHPWFHKAIMQAYEKLLPPDAFPSYFIFLEVNPAEIDINVHPTKTEIKFENEKAIWQILNASVRESLGKNNAVPSIDFDQEGSIEIPMPLRRGDRIAPPEIAFNPDYNPFDEKPIRPAQSHTGEDFRDRLNLRNWEQIYSGAGSGAGGSAGLPSDDDQAGTEPRIFAPAPSGFQGKRMVQLKQKYIVLPVKSGMMVVDQSRARERVVYEKLLAGMQEGAVATQQILFPYTFELNSADSGLLHEILPDLLAIGFDIRDFGKDTFIINGVPGLLDDASPVEVVEKLLEEVKSSDIDMGARVREQVAASLAKAASGYRPVVLQPEEMDHLIDQLFACASPNYTPDGRPVLTILPMEEIEKHFDR